MYIIKQASNKSCFKVTVNDKEYFSKPQCNLSWSIVLKRKNKEWCVVERKIKQIIIDLLGDN